MDFANPEEKHASDAVLSSEKCEYGINFCAVYLYLFKGQHCRHHANAYLILLSFK